ncbi:MAG: hypothetical protein V7L27_08455 [Nostoc sp.]
MSGELGDAMNRVCTRVSPRSQPPGWECIPRGSTSRQAPGGGASW